MTDVVIEAENVSFGYADIPVLEDVEFTVEKGEYLGIIGPNGSGKTTLLKLVLGLLKPDRGTISLYGHPAHRFPDGERLGYVSQHGTVFDRSIPVTVKEVVRMGRYAHVGLRRLTSEDHEAVIDALEVVGLRDLADRKIGELSGGQRQRAYIARAIASDADLLALDEPTVGVDVESMSSFYSLLDSLHARGITILLIEHDINTLLERVDTVLCINREVMYHGEPAMFLESDAPQSAFGPIFPQQPLS